MGLYAPSTPGAHAVRIVEGNESDLPRAIDLDRRAHLTRSARYAQPSDLREILVDRLALPLSTLLLAFVAQEFVGTVLLSTARALEGSGDLIDGLAHITFVNVEPAWWGRGIGKRLMAAAEKRAAADGFTRAQLWVRVGDPRSFTLYRNRGYQHTGDEKVSAGEVIVRLEKPLRRWNRASRL